MLTFKQWLNEVSTIPQLDMKARSAFPHTKKRQNDVGSANVLPQATYIPDTTKGELTINTRTNSSRSGNVHVQRIILYKVQFANPGEGNATQLPDTNIAVHPIKLNADTARVACDCMDFRFRFADNNNKDDSLAGEAPPAYQRVPGSNRGPANPTPLPGMCKHLYAVVNQLKRSRVVI